MKCSKCGAEVETSNFCPQCGNPLKQKRESGMHVKKASRRPSGILRMRKHSLVSETSLPDVKKKHFEEVTTSVSEMESEVKSQADDLTSKQSLELEALLDKLNNEPVIIDGLSETPRQVDLDDSGPLIFDESLSDEFFLNGEHEDIHTSGPIPVGSGSFARVPSGGFHPIFDSIKKFFGSVKNVFSKSDNDNTETEDSETLIAKDRRRFALVAILASTAVVLSVGLLLSQNKTNVPDLAAQHNVTQEPEALPTNEDVDIASMTFNADEFAVPDFDFSDDEDEVSDFPEVNPVQELQAETETEEKTVVAENNPVENKKTVENAKKLPPTEIRLYGKHDNVVTDSAFKEVKLQRQCIMREGPASRFAVVQQVSSNTMVKILAETDEDWTLIANGVWRKKGQPDKLGPGSSFADAKPGMTVPQPTSRVISSKNWRYIQAGDLFGYVGPACFK